MREFQVSVHNDGDRVFSYGIPMVIYACHISRSYGVFTTGFESWCWWRFVRLSSSSFVCTL